MTICISFWMGCSWKMEERECVNRIKKLWIINSRAEEIGYITRCLCQSHPTMWVLYLLFMGPNVFLLFIGLPDTMRTRLAVYMYLPFVLLATCFCFVWKQKIPWQLAPCHLLNFATWHLINVLVSSAWRYKFWRAINVAVSDELLDQIKSCRQSQTPYVFCSVLFIRFMRYFYGIV